MVNLALWSHWFLEMLRNNGYGFKAGSKEVYRCVCMLDRVMVFGMGRFMQPFNETYL